MNHTITEVTPGAITERVSVIDVREPAETAADHIPDALLAPLDSLLVFVQEAFPDRDTRIVLYCASGERSRKGAQTLIDEGYKDVASLKGGFREWVSRSMPVAGGSTLSRYARHLVIPEIGANGQRALGEASVAVLGAGGLGSPVSLYLAAAGVGRLSLIDDDVVDETNLQRQIIHDTPSIGEKKTDSAARRLRDLNPDVDVVTVTKRLNASNVKEILGGHDVVVDGADNFPTRYLLNDASIHLSVPVVHGSIYRFEGQISVFYPPHGPCYRCLFPAPPPPELAPNCAEGGVIGALPGVIGSLQALETIKLILGIGEPLVGRLMIHDVLSSEVTTINIQKDPECPACGSDQPPELIDYDETCLR
ncbi:MAG: molybdopterin-synthase adenylyltransferase MoeB [Acidimicrobiia bacterium]|nr:molybdopterin-synthase adenylyltransferase MoeB [Acidimicrobiia bacterium]